MIQLSLFGEEDTPTGDTKICIKCEREKSVKEFPWRDRGAYRRTECRECLRELQHARKSIRSKVGSPPEGYVCPICLNDYSNTANGGPEKVKSPWVIDHCHVTDKFRGWLCQKCNRSLGGFNDDRYILARAIDYLEDTT